MAKGKASLGKPRSVCHQVCRSGSVGRKAGGVNGTGTVFNGAGARAVTIVTNGPLDGAFGIIGVVVAANGLTVHLLTLPTMSSRPSRIHSLRRTVYLGAAAAAALTAVTFPLGAQAMGAMAPAGAAPVSPRDSLKTTIAGATISANYGRPSKRGREIFGGLGDMQWGMVWRTGANEATHFTTSKDLAFGSATVPAGTYTLYTLLDKAGKWMLIVNKQTGQWGTEYDAAKDLVRIPLTVEQTPAVVEKMNIEVTNAGRGGDIAIVWDRTKAHAAFVVK